MRSKTDAQAFRNSSTAQRNRLLVDTLAAAATGEEAVTGKTQEDQDRVLCGWERYCDSIGIGEGDYYLKDFSRGEWIRLMRACVVALRQGRFSGAAHCTLAESTVRGTISFLEQAFRDNDCPNPTKDEDGNLGRLVSRLFTAFKKGDPNLKQQKALPIGVLREVAKLQVTETQRAITQFVISTFFSMRSCEYLLVPQCEKRRTDILKMKNIRFLMKRLLLLHDSPNLEFADCVSVTFKFQKKDEQNDTLTQIYSEDDLLCPVRSWAAVVRRIRRYPGSNDNTPVSVVWNNDRIKHITSKQVITSLRMAAKAVGEGKLGFKIEDIGTHSIRSGAAMQMVL